MPTHYWNANTGEVGARIWCIPEHECVSCPIGKSTWCHDVCTLWEHIITTKLTVGGDEKPFPTIHEVNESLATTETEISWGKSASEIYHGKPR